jgi:hypothetical protein
MTFVVRGELVDRMPGIVEVAASMPSNDVGPEARIGGALVLLVEILLRRGQAGCESGSDHRNDRSDLCEHGGLRPGGSWNSSTTRSTGARSSSGLRARGDARYRELKARFLAIASTMGVGLSERDIRRTTEIVRQLSSDVKGAVRAAAVVCDPLVTTTVAISATATPACSCQRST